MLLLCLTTGCILYTEEPVHRHNTNVVLEGHNYEYLPWFEYSGVGCTYDVQIEESVWEFNALVDSYYGYDDVYLVQINVHGINDHANHTYNLWEDGYGHWSLELHSNILYCGYSYDIEFVAYDSFGDWANIWTQW